MLEVTPQSPPDLKLGGSGLGEVYKGSALSLAAVISRTPWAPAGDSKEAVNWDNTADLSEIYNQDPTKTQEVRLKLLLFCFQNNYFNINNNIFYL